MAMTVAKNWMPKKGEWTQQLRAWSGVVLFAFALTHFLNHALGIYSVEAMEAVQSVRRSIWRFPPLNILLYCALFVHIALALWKTASRRTLRMKPWEAVQILLGLAIPYVLAWHIIGTRGANALFDLDDTYTHELSILWPGYLAWYHSILLILVWVHSVIGFHFWLGERNWYRKAFPALLVAAVAVPLLALWGWIEAARRLELEGMDTGGFTREQFDWIVAAMEFSNQTFWAVLALLATMLAVRLVITRLRRGIAVEYPGKRVVRAAPGPTLLEISRMNGIPHTSVCGGRARCSTCRVRVVNGGDGLGEPSDHECAVLRRVGAGDDVRLACQIRPQSNITVWPLLPAQATSARAEAVSDAYHWGVEQPVAVMFVDIRNFTGISEKRLSYDVVFMLNRYLDRMSKAITGAGGHVDKYIGDGIMAMFGITTGVKTGCRQALEAAIAMEKALAELNQELTDHLEAPLNIGIGVHAGPAILGRIGAAGGGKAAGLTALGDTVNTASRLESASKELGVMLVVSSQVWHAAGLETDEEFVSHIQVRGREDDLKVYGLAEPSVLRARLDMLDNEPLKKIA